MRFTKPLPTSLLAAALVANTAPINPSNPAGHLLVVVNGAPEPSFTILSIPLINHNNGKFWSTGVQNEGSRSGGVDTALDTGGSLFILPSADAPPCQAGTANAPVVSSNVSHSYASVDNMKAVDPSTAPNLQKLSLSSSESFDSGSITRDTFQDTVSIGAFTSAISNSSSPPMVLVLL